MKNQRPYWILALLACVLLPRAARAAGEEVSRFALVVGNNRAESNERTSLRYADDDAVATHRMLIEAGVDSMLLVTLDEESKRMYGSLHPQGTPRSADLNQSFAALSERMRKEAARGATTELLLFYSGHGDVDGGEGYVVLEDGRLTRTGLYELLAKSPATHNHVVVDACKSHFLVFARGAGGRREPYTQPFAGTEVPARLSNTGFVLSTSADGESHEWERFQGGILSHEVRSGLRGAADANGDGRVTYAELGAFLATANESIPNARYRPDFAVYPPGQDARKEVLRWGVDPAVVRLDGGSVGHIYIETPQGERVLDAHPDGQQLLTLHVPSERPLFVRRNDESAEYIVPRREAVRVASLTRRPSIGRRGALHIALEKLFEAPFGPRRVADYDRRPKALDPLEIAPDMGPQAGRGGPHGSGDLKFGLIPERRFDPHEPAEAGKSAGPHAPSIVCFAVAGGRIDVGPPTGPYLVCKSERAKAK